MLGELHTLPAPDPPGAVARPGGAWHHLAEGLPREEIAAAARILDEANERAAAGERKARASLRAEVAGFDDGDGLPHALTHPDFVLANTIPSPSRGMVMVDWTGSGQGPRMWSLAFMLYAAGGRGINRVDSAVTGYLTQVRPEPEELDRLAGLIRVRPAMFHVWAVGQGRKTMAEAWQGVTDTRELADAVAARALAAFARGTSPS
jgi:Ser/Thr protein kinase RdoA (MazF antagonist)